MDKKKKVLVIVFAVALILGCVPIISIAREMFVKVDYDKAVTVQQIVGSEQEIDSSAISLTGGDEIHITQNTTTDADIEKDYTDIEDEVIQSNNPLAGRNVYFSGIADSTVNAKTIVYLENLPENGNDIYMKYDIYNGKDLLFSTKLIPAGKAVAWQIGEALPKGEYKLTFCETPYWEKAEGEYVSLTGGSNIVNFVVTD